MMGYFKRPNTGKVTIIRLRFRGDFKFPVSMRCVGSLLFPDARSIPITDTTRQSVKIGKWRHGRKVYRLKSPPVCAVRLDKTLRSSDRSVAGYFNSRI